MIRKQSRSRLRKAVAFAIGGGAVAVGAIGFAVSGNIGNHQIQIDGSTAGADLYASMGTPLDTGADLDWVLDNLDNTGTGCLPTTGDNAGIALCNQANVTAASGGTGHWNGVRIVDGIGTSDQDIFLQGGKENDTSTWDIGPGSVGSSKYDMTQAYLANDLSHLYFGMERRGNNGTTAYDFEFNALAPMTGSCPQNPQIPCRSPNDVLFTFEVDGSGSSGSVTPHVFLWSGSTYVEQTMLPAGVYGSTNNVSTPAAPWGFVDSQGNWSLGNLPKFEFAEAVVPIGSGGVTLPGVSPCGGAAYVQVRTRSSATATSDLKDASKVFHYQFAGLSASASKTGTATDGSSVTLTATSAGATGYQWQVLQSGAWTNIANATSSTLTYSNWATDDPNPVTDVSFSVSQGDAGSFSYLGRVYTVSLRMHASETVGTTTCTADSSAVTVKAVVGADP